MTTFLTSVGAAIVAALATHLFNRRKYKTEVELNEVECAKKVVDLYKDALEGVQKELALAREEIGKLRQEVKDLTTLNQQLERELKQIKKFQKTSKTLKISKNTGNNESK